MLFNHVDVETSDISSNEPKLNETKESIVTEYLLNSILNLVR